MMSLLLLVEFHILVIETLYHSLAKQTLHQILSGPPLSMNSISCCDGSFRWNLLGSKSSSIPAPRGIDPMAGDDDAAVVDGPPV